MEIILFLNPETLTIHFNPLRGSVLTLGPGPANDVNIQNKISIFHLEGVLCRIQPYSRIIHDFIKITSLT